MRVINFIDDSIKLLRLVLDVGVLPRYLIEVARIMV
jgi:hypothetical protein